MKKPLIDLIERWTEFESRYPGGDVDTFCRYTMESRGKAAKKEDRSMEIGRLARVIGRLSSVYALYHRAAMADAGLPTPDSFFFLNVLSQLGEVNKSVLINYLLVETTTGMEAINKLVKAGFIRERKDPDDKRAKLIKISDKGNQKLKACMPNARRVNDLVFKDLDVDALAVCLHILEPIEGFHTKKSVAVKQLPFKDMAASILEDEER